MTHILVVVSSLPLSVLVRLRNGSVTDEQLYWYDCGAHETTHARSTSTMPDDAELATEVIPEGMIAGGLWSLEDGRLVNVRESSIVASSYNRWVVGEQNRGMGKQLREQMDTLNQMKREEDERFRAHATLLSQQDRQQRARRKASAEHMFRENLNKGLSVKAEVQAQKEREQSEKKEWVSRGRELALNALQQKLRVREEAWQKSMRAAELNALAKQQELDSLRQARENLLSAKRAEGAGVRAAAAENVVESARRLSYSQRLETAHSVRTTQQNLSQERQLGERSHLEKARANKAAAAESRRKAKEVRAQLELARRAEAARAREQQRRDKAERDDLDFHAHKGLHDTVYKERYVLAREAKTMDGSAYARSVARSDV